MGYCIDKILSIYVSVLTNIRISYLNAQQNDIGESWILQVGAVQKSYHSLEGGEGVVGVWERHFLFNL